MKELGSSVGRKKVGYYCLVLAPQQQDPLPMMLPEQGCPGGVQKTVVSPGALMDQTSPTAYPAALRPGARKRSLDATWVL